MPAGVTIIEFFLFDAPLLDCESLTPAFLELLDNLLLFARREQLVARAIESDAPLRDNLDLRDDAAIEKLQVCVDALELARLELLVPVAQHRCVTPKFVVEAREFDFSLVERTLAYCNDKLLLILDALAVIEHRLQDKAELPHVTLISFASVCS
jgi:hypothetical protein